MTRIIEGEQIPLEEIKTNLRVRTGELPALVWERFFPDLQIPIGSYLTSALLPPEKSHTLDGQGRLLTAPHTIGHDEVEVFLSNDGIIIEKLVHYSTDGYDSETRSSDEILGETNEDRYRRSYSRAVGILGALEKKAEEISSQDSSK